jgi:DNA topoisomerase-2
MTSKLKIETLDDITHILKRPDMYVGSIRSKPTEEFVGDIFEIKFEEENEDMFELIVGGDETSEKQKPISPERKNTSAERKSKKKEKYKLSIKKEVIDFSPAILRIFVEAISNAIDNAKRSLEAGVPCTKIKVTINKETGKTTVFNDGLVIPIEINEGNYLYKHTMIFGKLRTSTNFNDNEDRTVSGRNGLGIKLTNVFSKYFCVKAVDPQNKKSFFQEWKNNMTICSEPKVEDNVDKQGFTEISWIPDFEHFGIEQYTENIIRLYNRYVFDAAMLTGVSIYLNNVKLPICNLMDYSDLFLSSTNEKMHIIGKDSEIVIQSANEYEAVSFVNGVFTMHGGKHVDGWTEAIFRPIVDHFNKPKKPQISIKDVKQFFRIFVNSTLINPEFSSQSKTELTAPDVSATFSEKAVKAILKWDFAEKIKDIIHSKEILMMKKSVSKKRGYVPIDGYMPANEAGGKNSLNCSLAVCEGESAKSFVVKGMNSPFLGNQGRDWFGVYPLRGKILNVRTSSGKDISENKEITAVIQALGLRYDLDYTDDEHFKTLNYGKLIILTDADTDGKHISGLIINFFDYLFPSLLKRKVPFIVNMLTPIAKFTFKNEQKIFYDLFSADKFYKENADKHIKVKYYKGLGTHSDEEIAEEFGKRILGYVQDDKAHDSILKAFDKKKSNLRKEWLEHYDPSLRTIVDENTMERFISTFVEEDLITHSVDNCLRSIPNIMDGLKQSQRKILFAAFLKNLKTKSLKVAQFAGYVSENTNYHHGEQNLYDTITKMAQNIIGTNNIPLLFGDGQFGSRLQNGKDAASARYIFTRLQNITRTIFPIDDDILLERIIDDGDIVEPKFYAPIIPMVLINGCDGIGTGWSSSIPLHNPIDVINAVRCWIKNTDMPKLVPWYRGFKGTIEEEEPGKFISSGILKRESEKKTKKQINQVEVIEIPINMSIQDCYDMLMKMTHEEKKIKNFRDYSGADQPRFVIDEFVDGLKCTAKNLKLQSKINLSNMVLFNTEGKIKKYETIHDIVKEFCNTRLDVYKQRKQYILKQNKYKIMIAKNKSRFLSFVMNGDIILNRKKEEDIFKELEEKSFDKMNDDGFSYLMRLNIRSFTEEKIEELEDEITKLQSEYDLLFETKETDIWLRELDIVQLEYMSWLNELDKSEKRKSVKTK